MTIRIKKSLMAVACSIVVAVTMAACKRNTAEYGGKTEKPKGVPTPTTQLDPNVPAVTPGAQ